MRGFSWQSRFSTRRKVLNRVFKCILLFDLLIGPVMIGLQFLFVYPVHATPENIQFHIDPGIIEDVNLMPGDQFSVDLRVDYVEDLWGFQFWLSFNPEVLHGVMVQIGPFLGSAGGPVSVAPGAGFDNEAGELKLYGAIIFFISVPPTPFEMPDGGGVLATVTFEVVGYGSSPIIIGAPSSGLLNVTGGYELRNNQTGEWEHCYGLKWIPYPWGGGEWVTYEPWIERLGHGYFSNAEYTLEIDSSPIDGVNFTLDGQLYQTPFSEILSAGSYVVSMPSTWKVGETEYDFLAWEDSSTNTTRTIDLTSVMSLTAIYVEAAEYTLEIDSSPIDGVNFTLDGQLYQTPFSEILSAGSYVVSMPSTWKVGETEYDFLQWADGVTTPTRTVQLMSNTSLTAQYIEAVVRYTLEINSTLIDPAPIEGMIFNLDGASEITPFSDRLKAKRHAVQMPSKCEVDGTQYWFLNWLDDNSINPIRVVNLTSDMPLTAVYTNRSVHNIDTDIYYETIQEAINASETEDGHTIEVYPSTFYEYVKINKSLKLIGLDLTSTIIDGSGAVPAGAEAAVHITADNVTFQGFTVQNSDGYGIYLDGSSDIVTGCIIDSNMITNCTDDIPLWFARNNTISNNIMVAGWPIWLADSSNNTIYGNTITLAAYAGIWLSDSHNNTIEANTISNSVSYGIGMSTSSNNTVFHNNFLDNNQQVLSIDSLGNIWDNGYPSGGNYWSDYDGIDEKSGPYQNETGSDGIGDTKYVIDTDNNDTYPLMTTQPLWFSVVWDGITYWIRILTNSTVTLFKFNQVGIQISFNLSGPDGTTGFCEVSIPKGLLDAAPNEWTVFVGGTSEIPQVTPEATNNILYFTYNHTTQPVQIVGTTVVDNIPPIANAELTTPRQVNEDEEEVTFDGSASWDNVAIKNYTWTFEDGTPKVLTDQIQTYTFENPGIYFVTLDVTDLRDNVDTDTVMIMVLDITPPVANASKTPRMVDEDTPMKLDGSASWDNVAITEYIWTFEDVTPQTLTGVSPTYTFFTPGVYTVTLNVSDAAGNWATDTVDITVLDTTSPVADASKTPKTVYEDTLITLDGSTSTDNVAITSYAWTLVDVTLQTWTPTPKMLTGVSPTYTFFTPGVYTVTLNVSDAAGNWATDTVDITVLDTTPPIADAGPTQIVNEDTLITFNGSASWDNDPFNALSYDWTFIDETPQVLAGVNPNYTFFNPGVFTVTLSVTDAAGYWAIDTVVVIVVDTTNPTANAGSDQTVDEDTLVSFDGSGSTDINGTIKSYMWAFTDEGALQILTGANPAYEFKNPGVYNVMLKVTDAAGNWDIDAVVITVRDITNPVADAGSDQTVDEDTLVSFDGSDSADNVGVKSYVWTFTDGDTSRTLIGVSPSYIFKSPDDYVITLNVTDEAGNWATDTVTISVLPTQESGSEGVPIWPVGVVAVAIIALAVGIIWLRRRSSKI